MYKILQIIFFTFICGVGRDLAVFFCEVADDFVVVSKRLFFHELDERIKQNDTLRSEFFVSLFFFVKNIESNYLWARPVFFSIKTSMNISVSVIILILLLIQIYIVLLKINFFGVKEFFRMNFDFKNACKNEFKDNNEKS